MKNSTKKLLCLITAIALMLSISACGGSSTEGEEQETNETTAQAETSETDKTAEEDEDGVKTIVDMAGREVTIPSNPKRIATVQGPTYEQVFMLGGKDQIALVREDHTYAYPLAVLTNPDLKDYPTIGGVGPQTPVNVEEFIDREVDLVIYWPVEQELKKFENAGIPAIVINWQTADASNLDEIIDQEKRRIAVLAEAIGGEAAAKAEKWAEYMDKTVAAIAERTAEIPEEELPTVYWANTWGESVLSTYKTLPLKFEIELCGGKMVSVEQGPQFPEITKEQLLAWEPDVIIVDNHGRNAEGVITDLNTNEDWAALPAVANNRIYRNPAGVFFMDKASTRPVYYYWLAKQLHPEKFEDIDLIAELQYYYETFYDYDLSEEEAQKVLEGWAES